jgi:hypothetical protein
MTAKNAARNHWCRARKRMPKDRNSRADRSQGANDARSVFVRPRPETPRVRAERAPFHSSRTTQTYGTTNSRQYRAMAKPNPTSARTVPLYRRWRRALRATVGGCTTRNSRTRGWSPSTTRSAPGRVMMISFSASSNSCVTCEVSVAIGCSVIASGRDRVRQNAQPSSRIRPDRHFGRVPTRRELSNTEVGSRWRHPFDQKSSDVGLLPRLQTVG